MRGSNGSIFALGDAATIEQAKALEKATQLFDKHAQTHADGRLTLPELQQVGGLWWAQFWVTLRSPCGVAVERRAHARVLAPPAAPHVGHLVHARLAAQLMEEASQEFPHLREHATFLDG